MYWIHLFDVLLFIFLQQINMEYMYMWNAPIVNRKHKANSLDLLEQYFYRFVARVWMRMQMCGHSYGNSSFAHMWWTISLRMKLFTDIVKRYTLENQYVNTSNENIIYSDTLCTWYKAQRIYVHAIVYILIKKENTHTHNVRN